MGIVNEMEKEVGSIPHIQLLRTVDMYVREGMRECESWLRLKNFLDDFVQPKSLSGIFLVSGKSSYRMLQSRWNWFYAPVQKKLSSVLFILTANEHILTESWLQIVEVAIISVGMSVQWHSTDYVQYFTI